MKNVPQGKEKSTEFVLNPVLEDEQFELDFDVDAYRKRFSVGRDSIGLSDRRKSSFFAKKIDLQSIVDSNLETSNDEETKIQVQVVPSRVRWFRLLAECSAEFLGTLILVLIGCSGVAQFIVSRTVLSSFLSVNFAFGFGAMIAVYVAGPVSGAHINPAVSIALLTLRAVTPLQCFSYIVSQFIGAFVGAAIVFGCYFDAINKFDGGIRQVTGPNGTAGIFGTFPTPGISLVSLFFDQVVSTSILLITVCALSNTRNKLVANAQIPIAVAFAVVAIGVSFGYNCGFPINPARDLAPRLFTLCVGYGTEVFTAGNYYFWIPCVAPIVGAIIGAWLYHGYDKLMKIHVGDDDRAIMRERYQVDVQNIIRM